MDCFRRRSAGSTGALLRQASLYVGVQKLLLTLRRDGYKCQIDDLQRNFKGQFKYADRLGAKLAVVIGDNELEHGVATCKDMISGEQTEVRFEDLKAEIDKRLSAEPQECKDK